MICDVCNKRRMVGNQISHSNIKTKKRQQGNIHRVRAMVNGSVKRLYACTRCLRSGKVAKAS
jgi:large subunit ribosomal protein L28